MALLRHPNWRSAEWPGGGAAHGGGLVKRLDSDEFLCIRRVTYSFSFEDVNPEISQQDPGRSKASQL